MPQVFRIMRRDADGFPTVQQSSSALGVRPNVDVSLDAQGDVIVNGEGMSVNPGWREASILRIPRRLKNIKQGAAGSNNQFCFRTGAGPFQQGAFAAGLTLEPDSATHGNIAPAQGVPLAQYETDITATRPDWQVDET
jgi:hypothetical protein